MTQYLSSQISSVIKSCRLIVNTGLRSKAKQANQNRREEINVFKKNSPRRRRRMNLLRNPNLPHLQKQLWEQSGGFGDTEYVSQQQPLKTPACPKGYISAWNPARQGDAPQLHPSQAKSSSFQRDRHIPPSLLAPSSQKKSFVYFMPSYSLNKYSVYRDKLSS